MASRHSSGGLSRHKRNGNRISVRVNVVLGRLAKIDNDARHIRRELRQADFANRIQIAGDMLVEVFRCEPAKSSTRRSGFCRRSRVIAQVPGAKHVHFGLIRHSVPSSLVESTRRSNPVSSFPPAWPTPERFPAQSMWLRQTCQSDESPARETNSVKSCASLRSRRGSMPWLSKNFHADHRLLARGVVDHTVALHQIRSHHARAGRISRRHSAQVEHIEALARAIGGVFEWRVRLRFQTHSAILHHRFHVYHGRVVRLKALRLSLSGSLQLARSGPTPAT